MHMSGLLCLGYQQLGCAAATALTVPAGTALALITPESQGVRWRADGTDPTASVGYPLPVGAELVCDTAQLAEIKFIQMAATASLNVAYFGSR